MDHLPRTELWGTFSVKDHLRKRPFVAEVLLYDRLMIPRPPTPEENSEIDGEPEVKRWGKARWAPTRLRRLLDILGKEELAIELPWNEAARLDWHNLYHGSSLSTIGSKRSALLEATIADIDFAKRSMPQDAKFLSTSGLIALYIADEVKNASVRRLIALSKAPRVNIEPVVAYSNYRRFRGEQCMDRVTQPLQTPTDFEGLDPYVMLGWEFFIPEDDEKNDYDLLEQAAKLASKSEFRETRQSFHDWLRMMHEGNVDPTDARQNMLKMLNKYQAIMRGSIRNKRLRYAAKITKVVAPLASISWGPPIGALASAGGNAVDLAVEWILPNKEIDDRLRPAALVYQARRFFRKK